MIEGLELRTGYLHEAASRGALRDLLADIFDIDVAVMDRLGGHDPSAVPFSYFDADGRCVANLTVFEMPLIIHGRTVRAAGYQSGAVRPEHRGRGLFQKVTRAALAWSQAKHFELDLLMTDKPGLYEPYGFEVIPQHHVSGPIQPAAVAPDVRPLSVSEPRELALIRSLLADRRPVSDRFAVGRQAEMFLFNAALDAEIRLSYLPVEGALVAWRRDDAGLRILDIVGHDIPPLDRVVAGVDPGAGIVEVDFPTDRLGWQGQAVAHRGDCVLMARGHIPIHIEGKPLMLSPMANF